MHKRRFAWPPAVNRQISTTVMHKRRFANAPTGQLSHEHLLARLTYVIWIRDRRGLFGATGLSVSEHQGLPPLDASVA
jgi:hypothetical protein